MKYILLFNVISALFLVFCYHFSNISILNCLGWITASLYQNDYALLEKKFKTDRQSINERVDKVLDDFDKYDK